MKLSLGRGTLAVATASILLGCAQETAPEGLPFADDFSSSTCAWSTDEDEFVSLSCTEGCYRVLVRDPAGAQFSRRFFDTGPGTLRVEADAVYAGGPESALYGVACWATREQAYVFTLSPKAGWVILRWNEAATPHQTVLAESEGEQAIPRFFEGGRNRIRGECIAAAGRPTLLTISVNGTALGVVEDRSGLGAFPGFGFTVFTTEPDTDVRFDDFEARELTDAEARAAVQSSEAARETEATALCKHDGIRYAGATADDAEICFTLRADGDAWLEIAFAFVRASGCPKQAMGTTYMEGPTPLDAPGRIDLPDFRATIGEDSATGVLQDPDICGSKTFEWAASRVP